MPRPPLLPPGAERRLLRQTRQPLVRPLLERLPLEHLLLEHLLLERLLLEGLPLGNASLRSSMAT
jgi:hypothetical protein